MLDWFNGKKTYLAGVAEVLMAISSIATFMVTMAGGLQFENGVKYSAVLIALSAVASGLGKIFQRMATADLKTALASIPDMEPLLLEFVAQLKAAKPAAPDPFGGADKRPAVPTVPMLLFAFLLMGAAAQAAQPVAIITGPKLAEPGEEIILDLSQSEGEPTLFKWTVTPELKGRKQLSVLEGGKKVRLASYPGEYYVTGMIANGDGIDAHTYLVKIPGTPPCPPTPAPVPTPPGPVVPTPVVPVPTPTPVVPVPTPVVPTPTPVPDLPVGEFDGLPAKVKALAMLVASTNRVAEAGKLADGLEAVSSQIAAGTLKTPIAIVGAIGDTFDGTVPAAWDADFRLKSIATVKALFEAGKLQTPDRWSVLLKEICTGLRAVK